MQRSVRAALVLPFLSLARASSGGESAVQKVVAMLQEMSANAKSAQQDEEVAFAQFDTWCNHELANLESSIAKEAEQLESIAGESGKLSSDVKVLGEEVGQLQTDVGKFTGELKAAKEQREKDHALFLAEQQDYGESVDALERAVGILSKQQYDRPALLQVSAQLPAAAQSVVSAFLGMAGDDADAVFGPDYSAPEAHAYESQSGGIVELLKKLKGEFVQKKGECEKEEMNSRHAFDMLAQDLEGSVETANDQISAKSLEKNGKEEETASLNGEIKSMTVVKAEDDKTFSDAKVECREKRASFTEKKQLRVEEIEALAQAIEILSSPDVQATAEKHLSLAQVSHARALVQTLRGTSVDSDQDIRKEIRRFIESESSRLHSKTLTLLAQRLATDPFAKVRKLIEDLLTRMLEEGKADADHEGFCDKELGESQLTRTKLSETIDTLTANIEGGKAQIASLSEDIARLSQELSDQETSMKQASEMRVAEKTKNDATVKDAMAGATAVQNAVAVLKDFYVKASVATALVQTTQEGMQTAGDKYRGQQDQAGGVLAMLEVIASDFASLKADTESNEALSAKAHEEFMAESKKDQAVKSRQVELNNNDKTSAESKLRDDTSDLKFAQDKLLAAERYFDRLKPQCLDQGMSFDERTKARAEELQSLKEALRILEGTEIA